MDNAITIPPIKCPWDKKKDWQFEVGIQRKTNNFLPGRQKRPYYKVVEYKHKKFPSPLLVVLMTNPDPGDTKEGQWYEINLELTIMDNYKLIWSNERDVK